MSVRLAKLSLRLQNLLLRLRLQLLGLRLDLGCGLFILAKVLLDRLLEVRLADNRTRAVALGLLLQVGAEAVQVEVCVFCLGAVLYSLPVSVLAKPQTLRLKIA